MYNESRAHDRVFEKIESPEWQENAPRDLWPVSAKRENYFICCEMELHM